MGATDGGNSLVATYSGKKGGYNTLVELGSTADGNGGLINVFNKTGEEIAHIYADEYGNRVVGAWNRKGKGRTLQPGP